MKRLLRIINSPFTWLVLLLLVIELLAGRFIPYVEGPKAGDVQRNPFFLRGWPEYVDVETGPDGKLVIIIGNSQGYCWEEPATNLYSAELQRRFDAAGRDIRVENWSIPMTGPVDHRFALLRALEREPDVLLLMRNIEEFGAPPVTRRLGFSGTDIHLLAGEPHFWPELSRMSRTVEVESGDVIKRALMKNSRLVRSRAHLLDVIAKKIAERNERLKIRDEQDRMRAASTFLLLYGHDRPRLSFEPPPWRRYSHLLSRRTGAGDMEMRPQDVEEKLSAVSNVVQVLTPYADDVRDLALEGTKVIWIWSPAITDQLGPEEAEYLLSVWDDADAVLADAGIEPIDMRAAIPIYRFYSFSHFDRIAHNMMADRLEPLILEATGEGQVSSVE